MIEVDVWVRGTNRAVTHEIRSVSENASSWGDAEVGQLLTEMLLALDREKNPEGEPPPVTLRGFNWIVSPYEGGVVIHLETQMGSASAGPIFLDQAVLTAMVHRVTGEQSAGTVH